MKSFPVSPTSRPQGSGAPFLIKLSTACLRNAISSNCLQCASPFMLYRSTRRFPPFARITRAPTPFSTRPVSPVLIGLSGLIIWMRLFQGRRAVFLLMFIGGNCRTEIWLARPDVPISGLHGLGPGFEPKHFVCQHQSTSHHRENEGHPSRGNLAPTLPFLVPFRTITLQSHI